jgi:RNA-directed DNA polymerase
VVSPLLANIYLNPLDWKMQADGHQMTRYADDFVILCRSQEEAEAVLEKIREWVEKAGLKLHPDKTRVTDMSLPRNSFDFLGYRFQFSQKGKITRLCRPKSLKKFKDGIREKTRRNSGLSMNTIVKQLRPKLRGWYEYFKHVNQNQLRDLDGWVRRRLRSILRRRAKMYGISNNVDHLRYPNALFEQLGLFSLVQSKMNEISIT